MDTSKNYYETVMRDFAMYARGRTLEQYCRDEAVDYKWLQKAQKQYGIPDKGKTTKIIKRSKEKTQDETPEMIQLHFKPEDNADNIAEKMAEVFQSEPEAPAKQPVQEQWAVTSLKMTTPSGYEIEIRTDRPAAVSELLAKLTA